MHLLGGPRICSFREKSFWAIQGAIGSSGPCIYSFLRVSSPQLVCLVGAHPDNPAHISARCISSMLLSKFHVKVLLILIFGDVFSNSTSPPDIGRFIPISKNIIERVVLEWSIPHDQLYGYFILCLFLKPNLVKTKLL